jgi:hypothetical protein
MIQKVEEEMKKKKDKSLAENRIEPNPEPRKEGKKEQLSGDYLSC